MKSFPLYLKFFVSSCVLPSFVLPSFALIWERRLSGSLFSASGLKYFLASVSDVSTELIKEMTDTRRRVKLYALNADRQWDDRGTGHVSSSYVDRLKGISLLVRAESDGN